ncbi:MAG: formimidoylglutamate deiminase [Protaetiibacter sp.]
MTSYLLARALVFGRVVERVRIRVDEGTGTISGVDEGAEPIAGERVLGGMALPGIANAHSHAFHRALRGRTHDEGGDFWSWRDTMYRAAAGLDPELYRRLATAFFVELLCAGFTAVGEFHYLHRRSDGSGYPRSEAMSEALAAAARDSGIRLTLLDAAYLHGGLSPLGAQLPKSGAQLRFGDPSVAEWRARHDGVCGLASATVRVGAAVHSVRSVDPAAIAAIAALVGRDAPLHAHVSEQAAENAQSAAAYGATPVEVLARAGALGPSFTAVHATHLSARDVALLAAADATVCVCPSTERDLGDGIVELGVLRDAGVRVAIGSDQHVVVDPFDELRQLEGHERLARGRRGTLDPARQLEAACAGGYRSLGWDAPGFRVGAPADLVVVDEASPRTAGTLPAQLWTAATAADVTHVVVAGRLVVEDGHHRIGEPGRLLADAIAEVMR